MKLRVYQYDKKQLNIVLRDILHFIKYNEYDEQYYWEEDCKYALEHLDELSEKEFTNLCIIATFVDVAYEKKGIYVDSWSKDKRVVLEKPFMAEDVHPLDFFTANQAEFNHNVFFVGTTYDVL